MQTIATFNDIIGANLAKARLLDAGIRVYLADEQTAGMAWHLTIAVGGIKVQVADEDVERAREVLAEDDSDALDDEPTGDAPAGEVADPDSTVLNYAIDDEEMEPNHREQLADRALRSAILCVFVFPLEIYVFWLLLRVFVSDEPLGGRHRRNAIIAAIINLPLVLMLLYLVKGWMPGFNFL